MTLTHNEVLAIELARDEKMLKGRFKQAYDALSSTFIKSFEVGTFEAGSLDFMQKRYRLHNGYYLEWRTRRYPYEPIGTHNQQTSIGYIDLRTLSIEESV